MVERTAEGLIRTTEWEDIQYKHGNRVGQYRDKEDVIIAQKLLDLHQDHCLQAYDPLKERVHDKEARGGYDQPGALAAAEADGEGGKGGDEEEEDDDDEFLAQYRAQRRARLEEQVGQNKFGRLRRINGATYVSEITEASANKVWVVAVLVFDGNEACDALLRVLEQLSTALPAIKFVYLPAQEAIAKFPQSHAPLVLVYHDREMIRQLSGIDAWGGLKRISRETVMAVLADIGVVPKEIDDEIDDASIARSKYFVRLGN